METIYHHGRGDVRSPLPDHPRVPDIESNRSVRIDARALQLDNGVQITSMIGDGAGTLRDRTFDAKRSDKDYPTFAADLGGLPAIRFNGTQMISNGSTAGGFPAQWTGPRTEAIVARINAYPAETHQQRLVTGCHGDAATEWTTIQPATTPAGSTPRLAALQWDTEDDRGEERVHAL